MAEQSKRIRVTVYTWPYQWVYQPAYAALQDVQKSLPFDFIFRIPDAANPTDAVVRSALNGHRDDNPAIALCEPPLSVEASGRLRVIPLLLRLPVWLFCPKPLRNSLQENLSNENAGPTSPPIIEGVIPPSAAIVRHFLKDKKYIVYQYPEEATTGRVGRRLLNTLNIPFDNIDRLPAEYTGFLQAVAQWNSMDREHEKELVPVAVSYTPLHFVRNDVASLFEVAGVRERVTGFMFREGDIGREGDMGRLGRLFYDLENRLKGNLLRLYGHIDPFEEARRLISQCETGTRTYPGEVPEWCKADIDRATLLTAFVRRGSFFPYESMDANLSERFFAFAGEYAAECSRLIATGLPRRLQRSLSTGINWWNLSAAERWRTLNSLNYETERANRSGKLANLILHPPDWASLGRTFVSCSLGVSTLERISFEGAMPIRQQDPVAEAMMNSAFCCANNESKGNPAVCAENDRVAHPCRLCVLMGGDAALHYHVHRYFLRKGMSPDPNDWAADYKGSPRFRYSPFQWCDLEGLCELVVESFGPNPEGMCVKIGLFPGEQDELDSTKPANPLYVCLGSREQQVEGSGGLTTLAALAGLAQRWMNGRLYIAAWRQVPWNGTNHWKQCGQNPSTENVSPVDGFSDAVLTFATENRLTFYVVARFEVDS